MTVADTIVVLSCFKCVHFCFCPNKIYIRLAVHVNDTFGNIGQILGK